MSTHDSEQKCPSCGKTITLTEVFFGRCQVCQTDLDVNPPKPPPKTDDAED